MVLQAKASTGTKNKEKTLPHNLEAERAVLAAMMMDPEAAIIGVEQLTPPSFYSFSHQKIFDCMLTILNQSGDALDLTTLAAELQRRGEMEAVGGPPYLADILQSVATSTNIGFHARLVREKALARNLVKACAEIVDKGMAESEEIATLLEQAEQRIFHLAEERTSRAFVPVRDLMGDILEDIESAWKHKSGVTGIPTGYNKLDSLTSGFQKSSLIVLAARPSVGKTALALNLAQNVAMKGNVPVGIFSLEMSADQIIKRILCAEAQVDLADVRSGYIDRDAFNRLTQAAARLSEAPIYIDDTPGLTIHDIRARARRLASEVKNLGMIVLDYMQLVTTRERIENRQQEVSLISRSLKGLARDLDVPVLALSQLSRGIEKRDDPTPRLSDLRESGAIEQDADIVMFIHRDLPKRRDENEETFGEEEQSEATTKLIIGKQRNGPTGVVELYFIKHYTRFEAVAEQFPDEAPF
jgi:replicative DNA helicase